MKVTKVKNRGVLFTYRPDEWNLNIYVIKGKKYNFLIDTGLGSSYMDDIKKYLAYDQKEIIVINTHYHWDHVWGNSSFGNQVIISHTLCRQLMMEKWDEVFERNKQYCKGEVTMYLPTMTFEKELYFPEDRIRLFHSPGHTVDSISILDEEDRVLILSDNIGDDREEIIPSISDDKDVYINTLKVYEKLDFDTCISGHNQILPKSIIREILDLLS